MQRNRFILLPVFLSALVLAATALLWPQPVAAQCGSQASSCKNCHEVQGQAPVNNDSTGWHQSHAFGDFCSFCHAGNVQATDEDAAHTDMVAPLSDVQASCASCHPSDMLERAAVYAAVLGVDVNTGGGSAPAAGDSGSATANTLDDAAPPAAPAASALVVDEADVIDYAQRYDETVSGKRNVNWGNVIVSALIAVVAVGGGSYVFWNERRLRQARVTPAVEAVTADGSAPVLPTVDDYPDEIVALLPYITQLNPIGLRALRRLLQRPDEAAELMHSLSRLDPKMVRQLRNLDRESRAMLIALAGGGD